MAVRVEIKSEEGMSRDLAYVRVYEDDKLVVEITGRVELKMGADGGLYNCVTLEKKEQNPQESGVFRGSAWDPNLSPKP